MRVMNQDRVKKYFNALQVAKNRIELNNFSPTNWESEFKLSHRTRGTLGNLGIVKNLGSNKVPFYEWNSKIPVTMLLAKKVLLENNKIQTIYFKNFKSNIPQKPIAKPIVKQLPKQIAKPIQVTNQVGLIRRFLKWIY
jgi:hypothetical protein